ncbi:MAG TPA: hypothetical protein VGC42_06390, partial [Kofleriaceae bacterium]
MTGGVTGGATECLDDNEVTAFVARRMSDAERARVTAHIDACELCMMLTVAAAVDDGPQIATGSDALDRAMDVTLPSGATSTRLPRGERIAGRYTLASMIGEGGMGVLYVADDPPLELKVALKTVRAARFGGEARTRLSPEARAMA